MKELSIILPVYNVEAWLERCIRSLEDQDLPHSSYEVVVVNDGSPDNSRDVVLKLMKEFDNIVFIEQENKGVSLARNAGFDKALGRYLLCVDPDDYILPRTLKGVIAEADSRKSQVTFLPYRFLDSQGNTVREIFSEQFADKIYSGVEAYPLARGDGKADPDRSWGILFDKDFLDRNQLRYVPQIPYLEDGELIARIMCLAERVTFHTRSFYMRTTRKGSAMNSNLFFQERAVNGFIKAALSLSEFRKQPVLSNEQRLFLNQPICKFVLLALIPYAKLKSVSKFRNILKELKRNSFRKLSLEGCNNYYKIEGGAYNISPTLFFLHRIFRAPLLKLVKP